MTKVFLFALLLPFFSAQQHYLAKRTWLFSKTEYSGNVPRMPGGQQAKGLKKTLIFYIETSQDQPSPQWQTAYFNGESYVVTTLQSNKDSVSVGTDKNAKTPVIIIPAAGDKIVQIKLILKPMPVIVKNRGFVLRGMFNNNAVMLQTDAPPVELAPDLMP